MRPESPLAVSFVGTFAVRSQLQSFYYEQGIDDRLRSQTPCFGEVLVVSSQPEEVEPSGTSKGGVGRTETGDNVTRVYPALVDPKILLRLRVVVQRNSRAGGEGHKPNGISGNNSQWTCPDASLIVAYVFEALSEVRHTTD